jgi:hypothetical protein
MLTEDFTRAPPARRVPAGQEPYRRRSASFRVRHHDWYGAPKGSPPSPYAGASWEAEIGSPSSRMAGYTSSANSLRFLRVCSVGMKPACIIIMR